MHLKHTIAYRLIALCIDEACFYTPLIRSSAHVCPSALIAHLRVLYAYFSVYATAHRFYKMKELKLQHCLCGNLQ